MSRGSAKRALSSTGGYCNAQEERERKRLALLHELVPRASRFAALISDSANTQFNASELKAAASAAGLKIEIFKANTIERSISPLLISFERKPMHSWLVLGRSSSTGESKLVTLAAHHRLPAIYGDRIYAEYGGW